MAITSDQIFAVADALDAAGQNPTLAAVRKALDGGSFTTISEAMKEWRARKAADTATSQEPAPAAVLDKLAEVGAEIWAVALALANARLASEREALEAARNDMEAGRLEAVALADQLASELDAASDSISGLERQVAGYKAEDDKRRGALAAAGERAAAAEARTQELEGRVADLRAELERAHKTLARAQADAGQAREEAATLRGRVEGLETALSNSKQHEKGRKGTDKS